MPAFTFHTSDGVAHRSDVVAGDDIETLDDARETIARAAGEAMRTLARSPSWGGTWTMVAKDNAGKTVCELSFSAT